MKAVRARAITAKRPLLALVRLAARRARELLQPSLARRVLAAQGLLLVLLWLALLAIVLYESQHGESLLLAEPRFDLILSVAENLGDQPERQAASLDAIDRFQREVEGLSDAPELSAGMIVRSGARVLYASPGVPRGLRNAQLGLIEKVPADGRDWRARTRRSRASDIEVTLVKPAEATDVMLTFASRGLLLIPLLISLPFLAVPAWLSMRLALRPWSRVAREIADRGPDDLSALRFQPRHRELRPLVKAVDALMARVRESSSRERDFVADAAHELRTPLAAMRVNLEALQSRAPDASTQPLLDGMLRSAERAGRVVAQLLSLMRADVAASASVLQPLALGELVQDRLAALSPLATARDIELELELEADAAAAILGERQSLVSLIDNLVENAIKYSPDGGTVSLGVVRRAESVTLTVDDHGPGIATALHGRVFDRFFRVAGQTHTGSGLGLAIVRSAAVRHGARVELGLPPGQRGLRVTVRFAAASSGGSAAPA